MGRHGAAMSDTDYRIPLAVLSNIISHVIDQRLPFSIPLAIFCNPTLATMYWYTAFLITTVQAQISQGLNHLRFGCSQLTIERLDPLVNPGMIGTPHTHQIIGGNAFNASIPSTDVSKLATCTTCGPADDLSNYWTANLYFKARNGTFKRVPQVPNRYAHTVPTNNSDSFKPDFYSMTSLQHKQMVV